ncbi:MAG: penicillin-binding transpeptidase domain-containing protein [Coprococcus sp.]
MKRKLEAMNALWKNFCVSDAFEPGSTMKPFTVAVGPETGKLTGNETYNCTGSLLIPGYPSPVKCHKLSGHGIQTIGDAIANSCNVALMQMAETIGGGRFCKISECFGFWRDNRN